MPGQHFARHAHKIERGTRGRLRNAQRALHIRHEHEAAQQQRNQRLQPGLGLHAVAHPAERAFGERLRLGCGAPSLPVAQDQLRAAPLLRGEGFHDGFRDHRVFQDDGLEILAEGSFHRGDIRALHLDVRGQDAPEGGLEKRGVIQAAQHGLRAFAKAFAGLDHLPQGAGARLFLRDHPVLRAHLAVQALQFRLERAHFGIRLAGGRVMRFQLGGMALELAADLLQLPSRLARRRRRIAPAPPAKYRAGPRCHRAGR